MKAITTWDRDIVFLPKSCTDSNGLIPYPRGKYRARQRLIGKVHLSSDMTIEDVENEMRSVFKVPMGDNPSFPFQYLQPSGGGSRCLTIPSVSLSFVGQLSKWLNWETIRTLSISRLEIDYQLLRLRVVYVIFLSICRIHVGFGINLFRIVI